MPSAHLERLYRLDFGLLTDLYQLTMAYGYWKTGLHRRRAVFHLFFRKAPFDGYYAISAGLGLAIDFLKKFRFSPEDIQYLGGLEGAGGRPLFDEGFLNHLQRMRFSCNIDAIPEGTVVFPNQPLLRVEGPIVQCQLLETALLNLVNFSTLIATKSARVVQAAQGDSVLEFGLRRAQGIDGSLTATRAAYIGGCHATSSVLAGRLYGIPVKGTHAHSWIMCFDDELTAFEQYAIALPHNSIFLVDTYDTIQGVRHAVEVGRRMRRKGYEMQGIRLDSGDLGALSKEARRILDEEGFPDAAIVASNELDEYRIEKLKEEGARITVWGVGTRLATGHGQPALGGVYKLSAFQDESGKWEGRIKLSEQEIKTSNPGIQQVRRLFDENGTPAGDITYDVRGPEPDGTIWRQDGRKMSTLSFGRYSGLLVPAFQDGHLVYEPPSVQEIREFSLKQQQMFGKLGVADYPFGLSRELAEQKKVLIEEVAAQNLNSRKE
ncbi:MAG: nicotinate phosphoribosyltransferase [Lewinellaceae bacterium]|nr:nicotinate phosphoribosyltransferase [Lewinellaceae bacterium]